MPGEVLVQGGSRGHEDGHRRGSPPPGPARLLPEGRGASRIARHDGRPKSSNVYPQFQGVRGHHALDRAFTQTLLDRAALGGEEARTVRAHLYPLVLVVGIREALVDVAGYE